MRYKALVRAVQGWVGNRIPPYVFKETVYGSLGWVDFLAKRDWRLEVLDLCLGDFTAKTRKIILDRGFGDHADPGTRDDAKRMDCQRGLAAKEAPGTNEPIIVLEEADGWDLMEGWHRTMARLPRDGTSRVALRAWVGRYLVEKP